MLASVTRLRVRSVRYLLMFVCKSFLAQRQAVRAPGFFGGSLLVDAGLTVWTLTVWESERAMKAFRGCEPHARVMPRLVDGVTKPHTPTDPNRRFCRVLAGGI